MGNFQEPQVKSGMLLWAGKVLLKEVSDLPARGFLPAGQR